MKLSKRPNARATSWSVLTEGNETREALTLGFQKKYPEIKVEHSSAAGAQLPPKLLAEQKAERYSVDVLVQGTTTVINGLIPVKAVMPIQPYLVGPNSRDSTPWFNKKFSFADEADDQLGNERLYSAPFRLQSETGRGQ